MPRKNGSQPQSGGLAANSQKPYNSGRLTWNLHITPFRKENDLPNLHDYGPCEIFQDCTAKQTNSNTSDHHHTSPIPTFPNRKVVVFQLPTTNFSRATKPQLGMLKNTKQKTIQNRQTKTTPPKFNIAPEK